MSENTKASFANQIIRNGVSKLVDRQKALDSVSEDDKRIMKNLGLMGEYGKRQMQLIQGQTVLPRFTHKIVLLYSPTCTHCGRVRETLKKYVHASNGRVVLIEEDARSKQMTDYLIAVTKGNSGVPVAIIDDTFVIISEKNFLERLTTTMQLAERYILPWGKEQWVTRQ